MDACSTLHACTECAGMQDTQLLRAGPDLAGLGRPRLHPPQHMHACALLCPGTAVQAGCQDATCQQPHRQGRMGPASGSACAVPHCSSLPSSPGSWRCSWIRGRPPAAAGAKAQHLQQHLHAHVKVSARGGRDHEVARAPRPQRPPRAAAGQRHVRRAEQRAEAFTVPAGTGPWVCPFNLHAGHALAG